MRTIPGVAVLLLLASSAAQAQVADVIFHNGSVETMNPNPRLQRARALAVKAGRIVGVGSDRAIISTHRGRATKLIDLGGRALVPGFVEPHSHVFNAHDDAGMTLEEIQDYMLAEGITTIGNAWGREWFVDEMVDFAASGSLFVRASIYVLAGVNSCGELPDDATYWQTVQPITDPEAMLRIPGVKVYTDGGACNWAASTYPVHDDEQEDPFYGDLYYLDELDGLVAEAHGRGFQVLLHSIGDRSRDVAMHAIGALRERGNPRRHRIDHNSVVRPDQIDYYRSYSIVPVVWGVNSSCAQNAGLSYYNTIPAGSEHWWSPVKTLLEQNLRVAWHLDWYAGPLDRNHTRRALWSLVTRRSINPDGLICDPEMPGVAEQKVTALQALTMATRNAAYAMGMDGVVGSLEVGKLADLVILDRDPIDVPEDEIKDISVMVTIVGGVTRMCAATAFALCP